MKKMSNAVIEIEKLNYKAGNRFLLEDITWQVNQGEPWVIFGLNGSGKTTLLSVIAGFGRYSSGRVSILGEEYSSDNIRAIRKKVGFVSSGFFDKYYTREKALDIVLSGLGGGLGLDFWPNNREFVKARAIAKKLELMRQINQPFNELSKGERQKVLIARALIGEPEILILDEPGTGLDIKARAQLLLTMRELCQKGITLIYVTHYPEEILDTFTKALFLRDGRIVQQGAVKELFTPDNLRRFLDIPSLDIKAQFGKRGIINAE